MISRKTRRIQDYPLAITLPSEGCSQQDQISPHLQSIMDTEEVQTLKSNKIPMRCRTVGGGTTGMSTQANATQEAMTINQSPLLGLLTILKKGSH